MALTKADIVESIHSETGLCKKKCIRYVETLLEIIKSTLESGDDVLISGFGKFCVNAKKVRKGRNPATGNGLMLSARNVVKFKCSGKLRQKLNG